jgi:hypothetical protein
MNLSTLTYLFKERGINIHGMSTTRRHKLSPLEKNLSNFLYITDLDASIQKTHLYFMDNIFTNTKIDFDLYKNIYIIQNNNFKKLYEIYGEILTIKNELSTEKNKKKNLMFLFNKLQNLYNNSMSSTVLICLLRNLIFELEKLIIENKEGKHKDLLSLYNNIKVEVEELINSQEEDQIIIKKLNSRVESLDLEIKNLEIIVKTKETEVNEIKLINLEKKIQRKAAKSKGLKKQLKRINKPMVEKNSRLNIKLNLNKQLLKNKTLEIVKTVDIRDKAQNENLYLKKVIENKKIELENSKLNLNNFNKELESMSKNLDLISNLSFSKNLLFKINRKNKLNKSDFVSNNDLGKRKFSSARP